MDELEFLDPDNHYGNSPSYYDKILHEVCEAEQIQLQWVSNFFVAILEGRGQRHFINGYKFDLNPYAAGLNANDKYSTYEILRREHLPVIEHQLIYAPGEPKECAANYNSLERIEQYLAEHNNHIVIKPNDGTGGQNVLQITSREQLPDGLKQVFSKSFSGSMCPFYDIEAEYRVVVLDGEGRLVYSKQSGDDWRHNLKQGARAVKMTNPVEREQLISLAVAVATAMGLRFCSVDMIKTTAGELLVMEINSGVMIEYYLQQHPEDYKLVKEIYRDAIRKMFA